MKKLKHFLITNKQLIAIIVTCFFLLAGVVQYAFGLEYVLKLTPLIIGIITAVTVLFWDLDHKKRLYLSVYAISVGMFAELIGVNTGIIFGDYSYSDTALGIKIFGVPLLVGIMWLLVTVSAWQISMLGGFSKVGTTILASSMVVIFDLLLEQYATSFNLWNWQNGEIPLLNYVSWFIVATVIFIGFSVYSKGSKSGLYGVTILPIIMVFFWLMLIFT